MTMAAAKLPKEGCSLNRIHSGVTMRNYSIVVPLHNEEDNVTALYARLKQVMEQVGGLEAA